MTVPYDAVIGAFLSKITEFEFAGLPDESRNEIIIGYMKRAAAEFSKICKYDLALCDDETGAFTDDFDEADIDEILDIVSEGMLIQWMKPYLYRQEILENSLNTADFTTYSSANLLAAVGSAYAKAQKDYIQMVREYSYRHGDLTELHS